MILIFSVQKHPHFPFSSTSFPPSLPPNEARTTSPISRCQSSETATGDAKSSVEGRSGVF
ncbi:hypothetical protein SLEP1_g22411 [Rubroshorea leprosula]|uniref:Uncharacterized protein n=1 Tax=Rubroshorea leprosula TaxID=152421 RepID=A0AAV5JID1_9ROSI|nr:hypothetical protein SLEP1_g22411 [Rubroshorea leprosula]